ncbi:MULTISPECIES: RNA-guided endonuclease InsQ/TnpB family protein [Methylorubrum]|uniref:RNA-guided endonuclease InsQ/TnpB family protein n=1 Tax=Methylorubrum TaxID=2282523 RepID=UPI0020A0345F|nr:MULTISPECIES: transposase [Methylorubrum]MCP1550646.1 IS605 OrfB family transposase [Methylorubrum zatmanii]MCP1552741.1 IS605 OrfB family transposase [Methylorubrum extorquens]MCP1580949.1 IS605 OrfB family transposase [Methylorubrum extorquens]
MRNVKSGGTDRPNNALVPTITVKLRLCDKHAGGLNRQARSVNYVWNYCNETQKKAAQAKRKWLFAQDFMKLTAGSGGDLGLHAHTVQRVCREYDISRKRDSKAWLRWRSRKSLGWVPFNTGHVKFDGSRFVFNGVHYEPMHLREHLTPGMRFGAGSFNSDAKGRWYINVPVAVPCAEPRPENAVGIDLGLKTLATLSTSAKIEMPRFYRESEKALATSQRAKKTKRTKAIHAKARNRRKDFLHKASLALVQEYGTIIVGDVSPSKLAKTTMAKSIYDAGWAGFRHMLSYKAIRHGGRYVEVSEAYSTRTCSACGSIGGPTGLKGLGIREWQCLDCGSVHDRDENSAQVILGIGLNTLAEGVQK